jgi:hypothetical protein
VYGKLTKYCFLLLIFLSGSFNVTYACDVPVYRYALERWPAERYEAVVFHKGALSEKQRQVIEQLERFSAGVIPYANYTVREVDFQALPKGPLRGLWESLDKSAEPPLLVLRMPDGPWPEQSIWSGSLTTESAGRIIASETRRQIGRRILSGEVAVWVLLECGDEKQDNAAYDLLDSRLSTMEKSLKLPDAVTAQSTGSAPELRVDFSLIRLSRSDPEEEVLVRILMHTETDLEFYKNRPIAFPVYGRGRVLYALVGDGINEENIHEACAFLAGPCACEIKAQNPGLDLLIPVDWDAGLEGSWVEEVGLPPLSGISGLSKTARQTKAASAEIEPGRQLLGRYILLALGLIVLFVVLLSFLVVKSGKRE